MRLGDPVYWLEFDRPAEQGATATVTVRSGTFVSGQYDRFCYHDAAGGAWVKKVAVYFAHKEEAECSAMGWSIRLVRQFKYRAAVVENADHKQLFHYEEQTQFTRTAANPPTSAGADGNG